MSTASNLEAGTRGEILCVAITPCLQRTLTFPGLKLGEVNRAARVVVSTGGKAVNVARTLHALRAPCRVVGFAGGETGERMTALLDAAGVTSELVRCEAPTRVCSTLIDEASGAVTELVEEAPAPAPVEWRRLHEAVAGRLAESSVVVAAGALPPGAPDDFYARLGAQAAAAGAAFLVDSRGPPLLAALASKPTLVKLNRAELVETVGLTDRDAALPDEAIRRGARELLSRGAQWVLVTDGPKPVHLACEAETWSFSPPEVSVVNPIGAGDATAAGIADGLRRGILVAEAAAWGVACGSASTLSLTPGEVDAGLAGRLATGLLA